MLTCSKRLSYAMLFCAGLAACSDMPIAPDPAPTVQQQERRADRQVPDGYAVHSSSKESPTTVGNVGVANALTVTISGPTHMEPGTVETWYANVSGGDGTYTYQWQYRLPTSSTWTNVGTNSSSYTRPGSSRFFLQVKVTSGGVSAYDDHIVYMY